MYCIVTAAWPSFVCSHIFKQKRSFVKCVEYCISVKKRSMEHSDWIISQRLMRHKLIIILSCEINKFDCLILSVSLFQ